MEAFNFVLRPHTKMLSAIKGELTAHFAFYHFFIKVTSDHLQILILFKCLLCFGGSQCKNVKLLSSYTVSLSLILLKMLYIQETYRRSNKASFSPES